MRIDIIEKKEEILKMVKENKSKSEICRYLQCKQETLNRYLMDWEIKYSGNKGRKGFTHLEQRRNIYHYLNNEIFITTHNLKNKLLQEELKEHRCESCGLTEWMGGKIPIELHHIDGDKYNNNLKNLQIYKKILNQQLFLIRFYPLSYCIITYSVFSTCCTISI